MRTFAKFSNVNNDHAVRYSHNYDDAVPVTKIRTFHASQKSRVDEVSRNVRNTDEERTFNLPNQIFQIFARFPRNSLRNFSDEEHTFLPPR